jgi:hypothetical protein
MTILFKLIPRGVLLIAAFICLPALSALAQDASQISPGTTAAITPAKVAPTTAATPQSKKLDAALTPETRKTLQAAMDSAGK